MVCGWQSLSTSLPLLAFRLLASFGTKLLTLSSFGRVRLGVFCHGGVSVLLAGCEGCSGATCVGIGRLVER